MTSERCASARGESFQTERKPQYPDNGHLSVNALNGQESELFRLNFDWRRKVDRVRYYQSRITVQNQKNCHRGP